MKLRLIEDENLKEYSDNPEPDYEDTVRIPVTVQSTFTYTIEVPKSTAEDGDLDDYIDSEVKELFPEEYDNWVIDDIDYSYTTREGYEEELADEHRLMDDSEDATQVEDIAKKEEYKKLVTPSFKVGKKIKEADGLDMLDIDDINKVFELYDKIMKDKGYGVWISDDDGYHATAYKDKDKYSCIFGLNIWRYPKEVSLHVEDRNGNFYLGGNTAAIYTVSIDNHVDEEVLNRIKTMVDTAVDNYGSYGIDNRLDFAAKDVEEERQSF